MQDVIKKK